MNVNRYLFFIVLNMAIMQTLIAQTKEIVGYYPNWQWYDRDGLVNPTSIDYSKYTIINYAFFSPQTDGTINSTDSWADDNLLLGQPDWINGGYLPNTSIIALAHNNNVQVLPSIGGWTLSDNFPSIAADAAKRSTFAQACIDLIETYDFDGIDLDWEYPGYVPHSGTPNDMANFNLLLQDIRTALDSLSLVTGQTYMITAAVGAAPSHMAHIDWAVASSYLDLINLMSYDFYGAWDAYNNHNSPLYAPTVGNSALCIDAAFQQLTTTYGVPSTKINIGVAFYGRSTTGSTALFATNSGNVDATTFPEDEGMPLYYNIEKRLNLFTEHWDATAQVPYLSGNSLNTFVSYDNEASIGLKAAYIVNNNAAGAIIWEITGDYLETAEGSGIIAGTPLADTLQAILLGNVPFFPSINVSNPTNNEILVQGSSIDFTANVTDADGSITTVLFIVNNDTLTLSNPTENVFVANWLAANTGDFSLQVVATDNDGQTSESTTNFTVISNTAQAPTISITNIENGETFNTAPINIQANASDTDGIVANVSLLINGNAYVAANIGVDSYQLSWTPEANGTYTLIAIATDNTGITSSDTLTIVVNISVSPPTGDLIGEMQITSDWGEGYCADIIITNNLATDISGWTLTLSHDNPITSAWNVGTWQENPTTTGNYSFTNATWNAILPAGQASTTIGFCASYNNSITTPYNASLNGLTVVFENDNTTNNRLLVKLMLEGAYNTSSNNMQAALADNNVLPLVQPFNIIPWNYNGSEQLATTSIIPADIIDWVLVELRDTSNDAIIVATKAALLASDGTVWDTDGFQGVNFSNLNGEYYVVLRPRNHLAVISSNVLSLPNLSLYDFTQSSNVLSGSSQMTFINGIYALKAGDINADGVVSVTDFNTYISQAAGINQYVNSDLDFNATTTVDDFNLYINNASIIGVQQIRY